MKFEELLTALGLASQEQVDEAVKAGACSLQFDKKITINIEHDRNTGTAQAYCEVSRVPATHKDAFFAVLLQAHMFGTATDGCMFGFDPNQHHVILFKTLPLDLLDNTAAISQLEALVNQSIRWNAYLPQLIDSWGDRVTQDALSTAHAMAVRS